MAKYQFSIPDELKKKFQDKVEKDEGSKKKQSYIIARLIRKYNNGEI